MKSPQQWIRSTGFRPKKAYGQNFLVHPESAEKIVRWAGVQEGDTVLEIGPGLGALTDALGQQGAHVIAIEKDRELLSKLQETWVGASWLELVEGDALELDASKFRKPLQKPTVVANLPYSISTPLLEVLLAQLHEFESMTLLLQEEVVDRIAAQPHTKDYGRLSIWVQTQCETEKGPRITKGSFFPVPDVESKLVRLTPRPTPLISNEALPHFLAVVALLFQHRRKTLRNALRDAKQPQWDVDTILANLKFDASRRPETLSIPELERLSKALAPLTQLPRRAKHAKS